MNGIGIKLKLIIIFVVMKVIPLIAIAYIAIIGANTLNDYFLSNTKTVFEENKKILQKTANSSVSDIIKSLDNKSQENLEKMSVSLANSVAEFLYERDNDILFLSKLPLKTYNQELLQDFSSSKSKDIFIHEEYIYDDISSKWISPNKPTSLNKRKKIDAILKDNKKEFHFVDPINLKTKIIPIYKEITVFGLNGKELYKVSNIKKQKKDIANTKNTYCKAEDYFSKIKNLKNGEIFVSDVIGAYVSSKFIGTFSKQKAKKMKVDFKPENHAYAGVENPKGKRFEGIVRFVTPIYENEKKVAYISLALDHRHIMEYTDSFNPIDSHIKQNISNARDGNYAFMWDNEARNISHPRDYFISGFNPLTGKRVSPWVSKKIADEFKSSGQKDLNNFLKTYPRFDNQSLQQKPNIAQLLKSGEIALDCRYLNFAPQCQGWMQVTKNGGYGSFVIFWSKVWKLSTAATIPYYTGQYGQTKHGFGFVTLGANVSEFHKSANKTKENLDKIIKAESSKMEESLKSNELVISSYIDSMITELTYVTLVMIILVILIAIWMSNYVTSKIKSLIKGTKEFSNDNLDYQIEVTSKDEIGELEQSFNNMAIQIKTGLQNNKEKDLLLIQRSKMAEMGDMMGAIIHQWKQPLSVISVNSSSAQLLIDIKAFNDKVAMDTFDNINLQIKIMIQTMDDFSNFFKPTEKKEYNLLGVVEDSYRMLKGIYIAKGVTLELITYKDATINGYPTELMQVLVNVLNNARDVIVEREVENCTVKIEVDSNDKYGVIKITDYAGGIDKDIVAKIFKPYFTTKSSDNGTGIGLDMSMNIIKKANGKLHARNVISIIEGLEYPGACFVIKLPKI